MISHLKKNSLRSFLLASRPKTLSAMLCPIILAGALVYKNEHLKGFLFFLTLLSGLSMQVLANLANDYGDHLRGGDKNRLGPPRACALGIIDKDVMKRAIEILILFIVSLSIYLIYHGGLIILFSGFSGLFFACWYSLGPKPLSFYSFSESIVFFLFGFIPMVCTYYLQTHKFSSQALTLGLTPGFLAVALMLTNNTRDILEDRAINKMTLAVVLGEKMSLVIIKLSIFLSMCTLIFCIIKFNYNIISFISIFAYTMIFNNFYNKVNFNKLLFDIGKGLFYIAIIISFGIIYAPI